MYDIVFDINAQSIVKWSCLCLCFMINAVARCTHTNAFFAEMLNLNFEWSSSHLNLNFPRFLVEILEFRFDYSLLGEMKMIIFNFFFKFSRKFLIKARTSGTHFHPIPIQSAPSDQQLTPTRPSLHSTTLPVTMQQQPTTSSVADNPNAAADIPSFTQLFNDVLDSGKDKDGWFSSDNGFAIWFRPTFSELRRIWRGHLRATRGSRHFGNGFRGGRQQQQWWNLREWRIPRLGPTQQRMGLHWHAHGLNHALLLLGFDGKRWQSMWGKLEVYPWFRKTFRPNHFADVQRMHLHRRRPKQHFISWRQQGAAKQECWCWPEAMDPPAAAPDQIVRGLAKQSVEHCCWWLCGAGRCQAHQEGSE